MQSARTTSHRWCAPAPSGEKMKKQRNLLIAMMVFLLLGSQVWAGAEGLFVVYQLEKSTVSGEISLRPVEISFDTVSDPALAVFAAWKRPSLENNKIVLHQVNSAYCEGLKVATKSTTRERLEVFLDYTECTADLEKLKSKSAKESLLEATAAAILYTENVPKVSPVKTVVLHVKGYFGKDRPEETKTYAWNKLQKKWKPYLGGFADALTQ